MAVLAAALMIVPIIGSILSGVILALLVSLSLYSMVLRTREKRAEQSPDQLEKLAA